MQLPSLSEYSEALQNPQFAFKELDLKNGVIELRPSGQPKLVSGGFAATARVKTQKGDWAIRCFYKYAPDLQDRYKHISEFLQANKEEFFVEFNYQPNGINVCNSWQPIVQMNWIEGQPLHEFVEANLSNPSRLKNLAEQIKLMSKRLRQIGMAHGDLQHGNILVCKGKLVLIDYDGMYVPGMPYQTSNELGHPNFQHPKRDQTFFDKTIDNFSIISIYVSLLFLATPKGCDLWKNHHTGENLIFCAQDYIDPSNSDLFTEILKSLEINQNYQLKQIFNNFKHTCLANLSAVLSLDQFLKEKFSVTSPQLKSSIPSNLPDFKGQFKIFSAHDILQLIKQDGERIAVVGRVHNVAEHKEGSNLIATYINFGHLKNDSIKSPNNFRGIIEYRPFTVVIFSEGLNSLTSINNLSSIDIKKFEGKNLVITGLLERVNYKPGQYSTPQIILENSRQLTSITQEEADRLTRSPFLCPSCNFHLDKTCPFTERPYVKECSLYQNVASQPPAEKTLLNKLGQLKTLANKHALMKRPSMTVVVMAYSIILSCLLYVYVGTFNDRGGENHPNRPEGEQVN
jgi:hypothetical protein